MMTATALTSTRLSRASGAVVPSTIMKKTSVARRVSRISLHLERVRELTSPELSWVAAGRRPASDLANSECPCQTDYTYLCVP